MYDLVIIGGGPAGLTAGIYAGRRGMKTLIVTLDIGGQAATSPLIENYPGFLRIAGPELMSKFFEQAKKSGCEFLFQKVVKIEEKGGNYVIHTSTKTIEAKSLIIAYGRTPKRLGVEGEERLKGKGISYCTICDGPLFKDKVVAVVGGGNSALLAALYLSEIARKVYLIHRREEFRGFEELVERVKKRENIEFLLKQVVKEIKGNGSVNSVLVEEVESGKRTEIKVDGVFVEIGYEIDVGLIKDFVKLNKKNEIVVNEKCETFYPDGKKRSGVFAAGDITNIPFKQIITAAAQGAIAALQAYNYLHKEKKVFRDLSLV